MSSNTTVYNEDVKKCELITASDADNVIKDEDTFLNISKSAFGEFFIMLGETANNYMVSCPLSVPHGTKLQKLLRKESKLNEVCTALEVAQF